VRDHAVGRGSSCRTPRTLCEAGAAHQALHQWCGANGQTIGAYSLEIYGDWSETGTRIQYLLR
jgi:hypothetical protein